LKQFLVIIERKPSFTGKSLQGHRDFLQKLKNDNVLKVAGGFVDQTGGAYVIQVDSLEEAVKIVNRDPMKIEKHSIYSLKEWNAK
jgi:uncharacterized protein YciI